MQCNWSCKSNVLALGGFDGVSIDDKGLQAEYVMFAATSPLDLLRECVIIARGSSYS